MGPLDSLRRHYPDQVPRDRAIAHLSPAGRPVESSSGENYSVTEVTYQLTGLFIVAVL